MNGSLRATLLSLLCLSLCVAMPRDVLAQDNASSTGLALRWSAPSGCPDQTQVRSAIEGLLEGGAHLAHPVQVTVEIDHRARAQWAARITLVGDDVSGERRFVGATCRSLVDATVLIIAMAIDPVSVAARVEAQQASEPSSGIPLGGYIGPRFGGDWGSVPQPTLSLGVAGGLQLPSLRVELSVHVWLPRVELNGPTLGSGGEIDLLSGALRVCGEWLQLGSANVASCVASELGVTTGTGIQLTRIKTSRGLWAAGLLGLALRQAQGSLYVELGLDVGYVFQRPVFVIDDFGPVFSSSRVIGRAMLGVGWAFP